jgi:hypothetical protein
MQSPDGGLHTAGSSGPPVSGDNRLNRRAFSRADDHPFGVRRSPRRHAILRVWGRVGAVILPIVDVLVIAAALTQS